MGTDDLEGMAVFVAVAESKSLRAAGERLGISTSAVSQALRRLEDRLGVVLVHRTTRSLHLTDAGERLRSTVAPAIAEVRAAAAAVGELADEPRGMLRLHVWPAASSFLEGPALADYLAAHPKVRLELFMSFDPVDIVGAGYDAGVRLGEVIERDMIAVPVSDDLRLVVVGAPEYFARHPRPEHPRELVDHDCIDWHPTADAPPYRWEFTENGRDFSVEVRGRVLSNDPAANVRLARQGVGLTIAAERDVRAELASGELVPVLEAFSTPFPGFFLYYPQRRQASAALRALIEHLRSRQSKQPARPEQRPRRVAPLRAHRPGKKR
jgi:DNA-binding transcriptional LysR family regulator